MASFGSLKAEFIIHLLSVMDVPIVCYNICCVLNKGIIKIHPCKRFTNIYYNINIKLRFLFIFRNNIVSSFFSSVSVQSFYLGSTLKLHKGNVSTNSLDQLFRI